MMPVLIICADATNSMTADDQHGAHADVFAQQELDDEEIGEEAGR